jgi:serine protease Do
MKTSWGMSRVLSCGCAVLVALACLAAVSWNTISAYAKNTLSGPQTAWYALPQATHSAPANPADGAAINSARQQAKAMSQAFHAAAEQVLPTVVTITSRPTVVNTSRKANPDDGDDNAEESPFGFNGSPFGGMLNDPNFGDLLKKFHGGMPNLPHGVASSGSGVIVDPSGVVLTNNHVVAGGGEIMVRLSDGREFKAAEIKTDPRSDVAIVRIHAKEPLPFARLGRSSEVEVGDWVLALGQPFGLEGTVTAGIVSAKGRGLGNIEHDEEFIQTDAAINPGNSGGPLVNLDGEVIGINTAISTSSGGNQGVGFAVPIDLAKWVGGQLEQGGAVHRAYLGVLIQPVTQELAEQFKIKVHDGVMVREVRDNTPAAKAGLQPGDVILKFAGQAVNNPRDLQNVVERSPIGSSQPLVLLRDGKQTTLNVTCNEMPGDMTASSGRAGRGQEGDRSAVDALGIETESLTAAKARELGIKADSGVVITEVNPGSPAAMAGLSRGMVITQANRKAVKSPEDLRKALASKPLKEGVLLLVRTEEGTRMVMLRVGE